MIVKFSGESPEELPERIEDGMMVNSRFPWLPGYVIKTRRFAVFMGGWEVEYVLEMAPEHELEKQEVAFIKNPSGQVNQ